MQSSENILGMAWKPLKGGGSHHENQEKNKLYVINQSGYIEEKEYIEADTILIDMSARGSICMSTSDKKTLQTIPFFEQAINYH